MSRWIKKISLILYCSAVILCLSACSENNATVSGSQIFYVDSSETKLVSEGYEPVATNTVELVEEMIEQLGKAPESISCRRAKPENVQVLDYKIGEDKQLTLYFSEEYGQLTGISEILSRAAIVKTMCQIDEIDYVEFYVNGQPLMKSAEQPVGWMAATDFIDNTGAEMIFTQKINVCVYFANETGDKLKAVHLSVEFGGTKTQEAIVLEQLITGPKETLKDTYRTLPEGTIINKIITKDGICYVDFNSSFLEKLETVTEEVTIYSVVNSLVELSSVNQVQITVDGEVRKLYQSMDLSAVFERKLELIEE